jgi:hypothetical protein
MLHIVTNRNFTLLDLQIEAAYRRRCNEFARARSCVCVHEIERAALLNAFHDAGGGADRGSAWLSKLASEMDDLAPRIKRRRADPRMPRLVAANTKKRSSSPASRGKRRGRTSL